MEVVVISSPGQVELIQRPDPVPVDDFVVVKIHAIPICTEYKIFGVGQTAAVLGHEAAGEVVAVAHPGRVRVGDRVAVMPQTGCGRCALCRSGEYIYCTNPPPVAPPTYGQHVLKQDWLLVPIPAGVSYSHGAMACCGLGPTFGAWRRMGAGAPNTVLIAGMGPVGLGGVINARALGLRVIAVEGQPYRARLALALGADAVIDSGDPRAREAIADISTGGPERGLDCSGAAAAQRLLIDVVRPRGQIAFVGESGELTVRVIADLRMGPAGCGCVRQDRLWALGLNADAAAENRFQASMYTWGRWGRCLCDGGP